MKIQRPMIGGKSDLKPWEEKKRNYSSLEINNDRLQKFQVTWKWIQASQINLLKHTDKNKKYIDILKIKNIIF